MTTTYIGTVKDGKIELNKPLTIPEGSQVQVTLVTVLDEPTARRQADRWLEDNVGDTVAAKNSKLIQREKQDIWRFEAYITGPNIDPMGPIGQVDIEATTGRILTTSAMAKEMISRGANLTPVT